MNTMNVNVASMSRKELAKMMEEMRDTARQQLADAITKTPATARQIAKHSGQTYYTDVKMGVNFGVSNFGGACSFTRAKKCPTAKFLYNHKTITHRFVEVDENGDILDGGRIIEKTSNETYYSRNPYFKGDD